MWSVRRCARSSLFTLVKRTGNLKYERAQLRMRQLSKMTQLQHECVEIDHFSERPIFNIETTERERERERESDMVFSVHWCFWSLEAAANFFCQFLLNTLGMPHWTRTDCCLLLDCRSKGKYGSNLVYQLNCNDCSAHQIGRTLVFATSVSVERWPKVRNARTWLWMVCGLLLYELLVMWTQTQIIWYSNIPLQAATAGPSISVAGWMLGWLHSSYRGARCSRAGRTMWDLMSYPEHWNRLLGWGGELRCEWWLLVA